MTQLIIGAIVLASLVVGFSMKYFLGETVGEKSQKVIENVLKSQTGVDVSTIFALDDNKDEQPKK